MLYTNSRVWNNRSNMFIIFLDQNQLRIELCMYTKGYFHSRQGVRLFQTLCMYSNIYYKHIVFYLCFGLFESNKLAVILYACFGWIFFGNWLISIGLNRTGHMSFLTGQDRTHKFAGQVLPDRTKSGLTFLNILHTK